MKLQDVILKALAKKITWIEAAEIAGMSVRNMQRMRQRYQEGGYTGLFDQRRGKRSIHRIPMETVERVLSLYREQYFDFNVRHFHEKLQAEHNLRLSYSWVKQALQGAGLVARRTKRGPHRRRRPRRPMSGMLLHIDGSKHRWFQATIPDGNRSMKLDANTRFSKSPRGLRFTVSVDGKEIYSEMKWPPRWYLPFVAVGLILASVVLRLVS